MEKRDGEETNAKNLTGKKNELSMALEDTHEDDFS